MLVLLIKSKKFALRDESYGKGCVRKVAFWKLFQKMGYQLSKTNHRLLKFLSNFQAFDILYQYIICLFQFQSPALCLAVPS